METEGPRSATITSRNNMPSADCPSKAPFTDTRKYRAEVHGVRGLAIAGVVLFHIFGSGRVSGGIDAFLAITGFLAVPSLVRQVRAGNGKINLALRWAGVIRRIMIPLIPLLMAVSVAGYFLLPASRKPGFWEQVRASLLGYENWTLISNSLDYNAASGDVSPLQHLWSISIQLQFHLLIPFLIIIIAFPFIYRRRDPRIPLTIGLLVVVVFSFLYASTLEGTAQSINYFSTWSRAWELCLAGAVALIIPFVKISPGKRALISWTGLGMLISTGFLFNGATQFPGPWALWPVGGLLLILIGGQTHFKYGPDRIWTLRPIVALANIAYSLYLWHWPILIFTYVYTGKSKLTPSEMIFVIILSLIFAGFSYLVFEKYLASLPFFNQSPYANVRTVAAAIAVMVLGGVATSAFERDADYQVSNLLAEQESNAARLAANGGNTGDVYFPTVDLAPQDLESFLSYENADKCFPMPRATNKELEPCVGGSSNPRATVLLTGGSHIAMWWDAFDAVGKEQGIQILLLARSACHFADVDYAPDWFWGLYEDDPKSPDGLCVEWNSRALEKIVDINPDLVVTLGTSVRTSDERYDPAWGSAWEQLIDAGIDVLALRDIPFWEPEDSGLDCLKDPERDDSACSLEKKQVYDPSWDANGPDDFPKGVRFFDTVPLMCPDGITCPVVQQPYLVYRDNHHVTRTFALTAKDVFSEVVLDVLELPSD